MQPSATARKPSAARNFPITASQSFTGKVRSSSVVPSFRSSAQSRMVSGRHEEEEHDRDEGEELPQRRLVDDEEAAEEEEVGEDEEGRDEDVGDGRLEVAAELLAPAMVRTVVPVIPDRTVADPVNVDSVIVVMTASLPWSAAGRPAPG